MQRKEYPVQVEGSMPYAKMVVYLWEESEEIGLKKRPLVFICPGGGYEMTSDREADPIASQFFAMGCDTAILRNSVAPAEYPTALLEAYAALKLIVGNAEEWGVDTGKIFLQGSSAGGHLAAHVGVTWKEKWICEKLGLTGPLFRPAGMILCYPVITSGEFAHRGSFVALLGKHYTDENLALTSIEKQVSADTPEAFIWHTYTDDCVPVENSFLLIEALKKYGIPAEFHMYPQGGHGLSTCDRLSAMDGGYGVQEECQSWVGLARTWLEMRAWK
ncbi:MAG: alpha/beta hydrolase [Clostridiales bacterium]|nr:alpha/beta hydrolase [Clostridiales bacterium]